MKLNLVPQVDSDVVIPDRSLKTHVGRVCLGASDVRVTHRLKHGWQRKRYPSQTHPYIYIFWRSRSRSEQIPPTSAGVACSRTRPQVKDGRTRLGVSLTGVALNVDRSSPPPVNVQTRCTPYRAAIMDPSSRRQCGDVMKGLRHALWN